MDKEYVCPERESFHFGLDTCACCLGRFPRSAMYSRVLRKPRIGIEDEIVIPAGRQLFCRDCHPVVKKMP